MNYLRTFESYFKYYTEKNLSSVNKELLFDTAYMERMFFYYWAFERAGASKGFKIVAVKMLEDIRNDTNIRLYPAFKKYYSGKPNQKNNPLLDDRIKQFDIINIISQINEGNVEGAFNGLNLNGINHKIRSFFIRDIIYLLDKEDLIKNNIEKTLYAFPLDVWVRTVLSCSLPITSHENIQRRKYGNMSQKDLNLACCAIEECYKQNLSPLKLNMGIWYYCSTFVADMGRLKRLLELGEEELRNEANTILALF